MQNVLTKGWPPVALFLMQTILFKIVDVSEFMDPVSLMMLLMLLTRLWIWPTPHKMPHLQLTVENMFYTFNTTYFCRSIAISTSKYSCRINSSKTILMLAFKGATKSCFTHYSFVVYILFNTGLCKSAFATNSFRKLVFYRSALFVFSTCLCRIWCNLHKLYKIRTIFVYIGARNLCICSHLWETVC